MGHRRTGSKRSGLTATVAAAALVLGGIPTASFALEALGASPQVGSNAAFHFTPVSVDPQMARFVAGHATGSNHLMRFTPAGVAGHGQRAITVAVRVDEEVARAIEVRSAIAAAQDEMAGESAVRIAPVRYNLGMLRGYQGIAQLAQPSVLSKKLSDAAIPDLSTYRPAAPADDSSRLAPRIALQHEEKPGSEPRTQEALGKQSVDLAESYRLTRNLDVSAGVRYSQQHDRLTTLNERGQQDSQAVYIGTQFRF
jgi:hypothetical protein